MIHCEMTMGTEYRLNLTAETMNEMVAKIKDWQSWEDMHSTCRKLRKDDEYIKSEYNSGWYYVEES